MQYYPPVVPLPVVGEYLYGQVLAGVKPAALFQAQEYLSGFDIVSPDSTTAMTHARLRARCRQSGVQMPDPDYWIAALALQHRLRLISTDAHFEQFTELQSWLIRV